MLSSHFETEIDIERTLFTLNWISDPALSAHQYFGMRDTPSVKTCSRSGVEP